MKIANIGKKNNKHSNFYIKKCIISMKSLQLIFPKEKKPNTHPSVGVSIKNVEKSVTSSISTLETIKTISPYHNNRCNTCENERTNLTKSVNELIKGHRSKFCSHVRSNDIINSGTKNKNFISKIKITKINGVSFHQKSNSFMSINNERENYDFDMVSPKASKVPLFNTQSLATSSSQRIVRHKLFEKTIFDITQHESIIQIMTSFLSIKDMCHLLFSSKSICKRVYKTFALSIIHPSIHNSKIEKALWSKIYHKSSLSNYKNEIICFLYSQNLMKRNKKSELYDNNIKIDIERTFPKEVSFKRGNENYHKLYNILKSFSSYHEQLGYVQGMNFLSATILSYYKREIDSFVFLDGMVTYYNIDKIMCEGNLNYFNKIMKELEIFLRSSTTLQHLKMNNINHDYFTTGWILTLFSNSIENKEYIYYIWECMFLLGWKFIYCFIYSIFEHFKEKVKISPINTICSNIKTFCRSKEFQDNFWNMINVAIDKFVSEM